MPALYTNMPALSVFCDMILTLTYNTVVGSDSEEQKKEQRSC